jgi:hypothetical protein
MCSIERSAALILAAASSMPDGKYAADQLTGRKHYYANYFLLPDLLWVLADVGDCGGRGVSGSQQ